MLVERRKNRHAECLLHRLSRRPIITTNAILVTLSIALRELAHLTVHILLLPEQIDGRDGFDSTPSCGAGRFAPAKLGLGSSHIRLSFHLVLNFSFLDLCVQKSRRSSKQALILVTHYITYASR